MSYSKGKCLKNVQKMLKNHIFQQKSFCDIFKSMSNMDLMFLGGQNTSHGLTLKLLLDPNPLNGQNPLTFSQQLPFLAFFELFLPTAWARTKISQHLLTKILESATHTLKSLNLKYYHHTTLRSVHFLFSKPLLPNVPLNKGVHYLFLYRKI